MRALVVYATREGQTRKIADHVAATMRARGLAVDVIDAARPPSDLDVERYRVAVLAASLHLGHYEREMTAFARAHRHALEQIPTAFLSVSLSEATVEDPSRPQLERAEAAKAIRRTIDQFVDQAGLKPNWVMPVAGALPYSAYGWLTRLVMRGISKKAGGPTDMTHDYEMTDWTSLDRFVEEIVQVDRAPGARTPGAERASFPSRS
jgi:menaquinone-dependent protoporphyrinogen oxidase